MAGIQSKWYWIDQGLVEQDAINRASYIRKLKDPRNKLYWNSRALGHLYNPSVMTDIIQTEVYKPDFWEDIIENKHRTDEIIKILKSYNSKYHENYWKLLGFTRSEARKKVIECKNKCSLSKVYLLNKFAGDTQKYINYKQTDRRRQDNKYLTVRYFTSRGYTEKEAKKIIFERTSITSWRSIDHWLNVGYTPEEAEKIVSERQDFSSKKYFVNKYGKTKGIEKYKLKSKFLSNKSRYNTHSDVWSSSKLSIDEIQQIISSEQRENALKQKKCAIYWSSLGSSLKDSTQKAYEHSRQKSIWCEEYWIHKGLTKDKAKQKIFAIQHNNAIKSIKKHNKVSKLEMKLFNRISEVYPTTISQYYINTKKIKCCVDMYVPPLNLIVEFFGDYWHMNPEKYSLEDNMRGILAREIWSRDEHRINMLTELGFNTIIIWESELKNKSIGEILDENKIR